MMQLAHQVIDLHNLPHNIFVIGFKINAFMNRLNMHVVSNDFCSESMRRINHWNTFNTELFLNFPSVCELLLLWGFIAPITPERAEALNCTVPVCCNQCRYITHNFSKFRDHLKEHWMKKKADNGNSGGNIKPIFFISQNLSVPNNFERTFQAPRCGAQQGPRPRSGPTEAPRPQSKWNPSPKSGSQQESGCRSESQLRLEPGPRQRQELSRAQSRPQEVTRVQSGLQEKPRSRSSLNQTPESGGQQETGYRSRSIQEPRTGSIQQQGLRLTFPPFPGPRPNC